MDVHHFNRSQKPRRAAVVHPLAAALSFEDAAMATVDQDAAYTLDAGFESLGDRDFLLVPGIMCQPRDGSLSLQRCSELA